MRGAKWLSLGAVVAGLGAAFACSSSPPAQPYPDVSSFCSALASAECQVTAACGASLSTDACESTETTNCTNAASSATAAGTRTYQPGNAKACIDLATKTYGNTAGSNANPLVNAAAIAALDVQCEAVFAGSVGDDSTTPCTSDDDCSNTTSVCTFIPVTAATGLCGQPSSTAEGAACNNPGQQCTNSYCGGSAYPYSCTALLPNGAACAVDAQCEGHCVNDACVSLGGTGASCTTSQDCNPSVSAGYCDPNANNTCDEGEIFAPGAAVCSNFGFGATTGSGSSSSSSSSSSSGSSSGSSSSSSSSSGSSSGVVDSGTD